MYMIARTQAPSSAASNIQEKVPAAVATEKIKTVRTTVGEATTIEGAEAADATKIKEKTAATAAENNKAGAAATEKDKMEAAIMSVELSVNTAQVVKLTKQLAEPDRELEELAAKLKKQVLLTPRGTTGLRNRVQT